MIGQYVKIGFLALLFICLYSNVNAGHAEVVWSDDFDDGDYDGWIGVMGALSAENGTLHSTVSGEIVPDWYLMSGVYHPSTVQYGTWSFDFLLNGSRSPEIAVDFIALSTYKWEMGEEKTKNYGFFAGAYRYSQYELYKETQFPNAQILELAPAPSTVENIWHHVDITRDEDGRIIVYVDDELVIDYVDKEYKESKYFGVHLEYSSRGTAYIDNIVVSDTVDIEPPPKKVSWRIPGFPFESVIMGTIVGTFLLWLMQRRR